MFNQSAPGALNSPLFNMYSAAYASGGYVAVDDAAAIDITGDLSWECKSYWTNFPGTGGISSLGAKGLGIATSEPGYYAYLFHISSGPDVYQVRMGICDGSSNLHRVYWTVTGLINLNQVHHTAFTFDASASEANEFKFYLDGVDQGAYDGTLNSANMTQVGTNSVDFHWGEWLTGWLDGYQWEMRIWNDLRTAAEIDQYKEVSVDPNSANLAFYCPNDGSVLHDSGSGGLAVTLVSVSASTFAPIALG